MEAERTGLFVTYRLADPLVGDFFLQLRRLAESQLAEIERVTRQYLEERGALEPVNRDELIRRMRTGQATLIDVRPREEYLTAHIPGAVSVPLGELKRRVGELGKYRDIIAYCRGPYCVMALDAVDYLRRKGFRAYRLDLGVPEWRTRGFRVESGDGVRKGTRPRVRAVESRLD